MPFRDSVAVSVRIGMPWKRDFPFINLEGKMPLFDQKCALNQPKMVQNTWNLHQSSISVGTFSKYEQKYIAVKILAAATHFPLKFPRIPFIKGKNPFFCEITQKASTLRNIVIEVWNLAWIILISVSKKLPSRFSIFWAVATLLREIHSKKGKKGGNRGNFPQ